MIFWIFIIFFKNLQYKRKNQFEGMSILKDSQDDFNINISKEDLSRNDSKCTNGYISKFKLDKLNNHFEQLEIHSPLCDYIKKLNESSIDLLNNINELLERFDFESDSRFFIFNQVNCETLDLYFQTLFNWIEMQYVFCSSSETSLNSTEGAIDLISELNQILSGILSMCEKLKLSQLELDHIQTNESAEKILNFYKNFNQHFEKLLLDYVGEIHVMVFEMVLEFEIDNKETQKFDECAIKCQKALGDNILNINNLAKNLDETEESINNNTSINNDTSISLGVEDTNYNNETLRFDEGNKTIEFFDIQRNETEKNKYETNKDQYNFLYDYYDEEPVEEPFIDPFDSFHDNFFDSEDDFFDNIEERFKRISATEASILRPRSFNHSENKTTNLFDATNSIKTNLSSIGSERLSGNVYSSFYLYSIIPILIISFAGIIGGFVAYCRSKKKQTKKMNRENVDDALL
ncbi:hypothetical protein NBO_619g0001 [Nosema bombycis CQ1]|uniref:Uncharacterized protein n=1 Tax=Nosema bombycis (strain CQ1 / CVCC 102059) TaxID=578461 RepID=R0M1R1_NOSB1|nr:hypothetical protein NBO_619g0001 [Nosema bombycis CQ1]|eukprot:EOB11949.1 hypothetical protein NBO_619g0001 [Nosema bombycis CQ1]